LIEAGDNIMGVSLASGTTNYAIEPREQSPQIFERLAHDLV